MTDEPTNAQLLAAAAGLILTARNAIEATDLNDVSQTKPVLLAMHEGLAVAGGSIAMLADRLGCEAEFTERVQKGQDRLKAYQASAGLGGRA